MVRRGGFGGGGGGGKCLGGGGGVWCGAWWCTPLPPSHQPPQNVDLSNVGLGPFFGWGGLVGGS